MNYGKEIECLNKDKKKAELKGNLTEQAEYCSCLGEAYAKSGDFESAISEHKEELNIYEALSDKIGQAVAYRRIGECLMEIGNFELAEKNQKLYLDLAKACGNKTEEQRAWATLGRTYLCQYETLKGPVLLRQCLQKAEKAFNQSLSMCISLVGNISAKDYNDMRARLILNLGLVEENRQKREEAIKLVLQASTIAQKCDLYDTVIRCQLTLSHLYLKVRKFPESMLAITKCVQYTVKSKDKSTELEGTLVKAKLHVELEDFSAAKTCLKRSYKMCATEDKADLKKNLVSVYKLKQMHGNLKPDSPQCCMVDFEKMGDLASGFGAYNIAITYYHNVLRYSKAMNKPAKDLIPIYVSLAATYCDTEQYDLSLKYYTSELKAQEGNNEQCCRTWLNIADIQERASYDYNVILDSLHRAYEFAKKAKHSKLQVRCLQFVCTLNETHDKCHEDRKDVEMYENMKKELNVTSIYSSDESEDAGDDEDDVDLIDMTDSDESGGEEFDRSLSTKSRRYAVKMNEKGETPLHVACIAGRLKQVEQLIERGHPVSIRDNCGWTPLHEVCNHGFLEIARYLIDKGAKINDRGGTGCDGITPLHDACSNGNLDIIRLLLQKGANVHAKDVHGNTPYDCLRKFHQGAISDLDIAENEMVTEVEDMLFRKISGNKGRQPRPVEDIVPDIVSRRKQRKNIPSVDFSEPTDQDEDDNVCEQSTVYQISNTCVETEDVMSAFGARRAYQDVMKTVRKSALNSNSSTQRTHSFGATIEKSALVNQEEFINDSDWLVDDVVTYATLKQSRESASFLNSTGIKKRKRRSTDSEDIMNSPKLLNYGLKGRKVTTQNEMNVPSQSRNLEDEIPDIETFTHHSRQHSGITNDGGFDDELSDTDFINLDVYDSDNYNINEYSSDIGHLDAAQPISSSSNVDCIDSSGYSSGRTNRPETPINNHSSISTGGILRIKVKILDKIILVPVTLSDGGNNINWLCQEVSKRYFQLYGIKPLITLNTKDGACLCPNDCITLVLTTNEQLEAVFIRWDLPPLPDRYKEACAFLKSVPYRNVKTLMQKSCHSSIVDLSKLFLRTNQLQPIFSALQCESTLKELVLHGNKLDNTGIVHLKGALTTLPNLSHLDLSSNQLTADSIKQLATLMTDSEEKPLQNLEVFNIGYNFLGDHCLCHLVALLKNLPLLDELNLTSCKITSRSFTLQPLSIAEALKGSSLTTINMSYNPLANTGVETLLKYLNHRRIAQLNLEAVIPSIGGGIMVPTYIENYLKRPGCVLKKLNLEKCFIAEDIISNLILNNDTVMAEKPVLTSGLPNTDYRT